MNRFKLDGQLRLVIELALTAGKCDPVRLQSQENEARRLGMTGAEIDAARRGTSFDLLASLAVALAVAAAGDDPERLCEMRSRALRAGIPEEVGTEIESLALDIVASLPKDDCRHA